MNHQLLYETHAAFDLESLPVTKLTRLLRQLGERGDFARVVKEKQIAKIEAHPAEGQALALIEIGEDPERLRLRESTALADRALQRHLVTSQMDEREEAPEPEPASRTSRRPPLVKARPKAGAPDVPITAVPEDVLEAFERQDAAAAHDAVADLEKIAALIVQLLVDCRRAVDRELIGEVVRSELARRPGPWSDSD